ncbi:2-hydroxyacid dehydrogenase [Agromyces aerolatus]|uniref:2-hydroxyacid dehydrogenase n=1 Tax=Agromyces sp. LY-1074 TaxID=3074080 RepID=UPI002862DDED|nr:MULTISPECIES: 2-hydroxyacid dehydrogenase [unclassified Agromyces]MDR5700559.1 2-hydroxyacid dehydrogenase [Agromyces sp. LY-1074]MDR5707080.1 2-hydroxyacid dehydrogenase [Agromyces sp. LY-1358]
MSEPRLVVSLPGETLRAAVGELPEGVQVVVWDLDSPAPAPAIDLVVPPYMGASKRLRALEGVSTRLVQSQSIGYDDIPANLPPGHVFANAASVHEASTAELAVALTLAAQRGLPDFVRAAASGRWAPARHDSLADRRVLLVGYGGVGRAIEERLDGFEVELTRVASRARDDEHGRIHGIDELAELLPAAEIVIVGVPLTESTTGLVDAGFLAALPDGALVVNIARGKVADTEAILAEAGTGRLRFAMDVIDPEPLPEGHPLFALENVLISPHVGGATSAMMPRMARLVRRQVERMLRGEEPLNVVYRS